MGKQILDGRFIQSKGRCLVMENSKNTLVCPYCKEEQNPLNIPLRMKTDLAWVAYDCEKCGRTFGYVQVVTRSYVTVEIEEKRI